MRGFESRSDVTPFPRPHTNTLTPKAKQTRHELTLAWTCLTSLLRVLQSRRSFPGQSIDITRSLGDHFGCRGCCVWPSTPVTGNMARSLFPAPIASTFDACLTPPLRASNLEQNNYRWPLVLVHSPTRAVGPRERRSDTPTPTKPRLHVAVPPHSSGLLSRARVPRGQEPREAQPGTGGHDRRTRTRSNHGLQSRESRFRTSCPLDGSAPGAIK